MRATFTSVTPQGRELRTELADWLTADLRETARVEANAWIKRLRSVAYDGQTMRERFMYRGDSLWWFTELFLHKMRRLDTAVASALALEALCARETPARLRVETDDRTIRETAEAFGHAQNLAVDVAGPVSEPNGRDRDSFLIGLTARLSRLRPARAIVPRQARVAAFVHTAFWRESGDDGPDQESYIGPVLSALAAKLGPNGMSYIGVGPRQNFRARRWWDPVTTIGSARPLVTPIERLSRRVDLNASLALWSQRQDLARALTAGDEIRAAGIFRQLDLWPVLRRELEGVALLQWPWSARAMDEAGSAIDALMPDVILTYAEAGGWGRALMLEARRRGVRSIGLQHGFIYRHWLNYRHEPDEMARIGGDRGFPAPDQTLLFDGYARRWLETAGHFAPASLVVTGNPGLDALVRRLGAIDESDHAIIRGSLGVQDDQRVVVLAAKFSEARPYLPGLAAALRTRPRVQLVVKTHPAETPELYAAPFAGLSNVTIAPAATDLARALAIADGLVTVNSTVALDALVLEIPSLVIGLPNNLSPFVSAGVMLGAHDDGAVGERLDALLYDESARRELANAASRFTSAHGMGSDGHAADRAADAILRS